MCKYVFLLIVSHCSPFHQPFQEDAVEVELRAHHSGLVAILLIHLVQWDWIFA